MVYPRVFFYPSSSPSFFNYYHSLYFFRILHQLNVFLFLSFLSYLFYCFRSLPHCFIFYFNSPHLPHLPRILLLSLYSFLSSQRWYFFLSFLFISPRSAISPFLLFPLSLPLSFPLSPTLLYPVLLSFLLFSPFSILISPSSLNLYERLMLRTKQQS